MDRHGADGKMNVKGELLTDFCNANELVIGGSLFPHIMRWVWLMGTVEFGEQTGKEEVEEQWKSDKELISRNVRGRAKHRKKRARKMRAFRRALEDSEKL